MPPSLHAVLGASSAHRWLVCTPSARLCERLNARFGSESSPYRELYDEEYQSVMEAAIKSKKYKSASPEERAELLEEARDDVASQVKDEFLKWLRKNYESTRKKKK